MGQQEITNGWNKIFHIFVTKKFIACLSGLTPLPKSLVKEGSPRIKNNDFKGFVASQYTNHKHKDILSGRPPSPSYLRGR